MIGLLLSHGLWIAFLRTFCSNREELLSVLWHFLWTWVTVFKKITMVSLRFSRAVRHGNVNYIQNPSTVTNPSIVIFYHLSCRPVQRDKSQTHYQYVISVVAHKLLSFMSLSATIERLPYGLRTPVWQVFSYGIRHVFIVTWLWFIKLWVRVHWITMKTCHILYKNTCRTRVCKISYINLYLEQKAKAILYI